MFTYHFSALQSPLIYYFDKKVLRMNVLCYTRNTCFAEPREARGRVRRVSKLWWRLDLRMRPLSI